MDPLPDRRRHPPAAALASLVIPPPVVDRVTLDGLIDGWCDLARRGFVQASLLLIGLPSSVAVEVVSPELIRVVRDLDVVGRFDLRTLAVLIDADAVGARQCADRVASAAARAGGHPGWIGVSVAQCNAIPEVLVPQALRAVARARQVDDGAVVVGS